MVLLIIQYLLRKAGIIIPMRRINKGCRSRQVHSMKMPGDTVYGRSLCALEELMYLELSVTFQENLTKTNNEHHF